MGNQNQWPAARAYNRRGANTFHTPGDPYGISGFATVWILMRWADFEAGLLSDTGGRRHCHVLWTLHKSGFYSTSPVSNSNPPI